MVVYGINKKSYEFAEVDEKGWVRESAEKFQGYEYLCDLMKSETLIVDYYNKVVRLLFWDRPSLDKEWHPGGAVDDIIDYYNKNDGIDFIVVGYNPNSIKYQGFSYEYQQLPELDEDAKIAFIERLNQKASEPYEPGPGYWWKDVADSLQKYNSVLQSGKTCSECRNGTVYIYFRSPSYTWESLCGTAGPMEICPHCMRQISYNEEVMN